MDKTSNSRESRGPYLRRITPAKRNPRLLALVGFGAGAAFASAVAVVVYLNAVSNPPVMETITLDPAAVAAEMRPAPVNETQAVAAAPAAMMAPVAAPSPPSSAPESGTASAPSIEKSGQDPVLSPSAITIVQSPLEPKRVATVVIRPDAPVPAADDPRWAVAASMPRNKALDALREKLSAGDETTVDEAGPDQTVTAALVPSDPPKGQPLSRSIVAEPEREKTTKKALVSQAVKLRAGPDNKSAVLGVLPARAEVRLGTCKGWCRVSYQGKSGYVWKSYLRPAKPLNALAGG